MERESVTSKPKYSREDFITFYNEKCIAGESNDACFQAYYGTGIEVDSHPLRNKIDFKSCANCKSDNVLVVFAEYSIARHSGDERRTYELCCKDCGKFTNSFIRDK